MNHWWNVKQCNHYEKWYNSFSKNKNRITISPSNFTFGIYPKELKTGIWSFICTPMFIEALFTKAKRWKQPHVTIVRWMDKQNMEYTHNEYHSSLLVQFSSVAQSCPTLLPHGLQHARLFCPSPTSRACSNSCPLSWSCHPTILSSVVPFFSCPQSLPASKSFPMSQLFAWGGQSTGVSALASFLPKKSQGWSPSEWTGWISFQSKGLSRVFSNTTVQKHQFLGTQLSLWSTFTSVHVLLKKP